jgi:hypothetical protein
MMAWVVVSRFLLGINECDFVADDLIGDGLVIHGGSMSYALKSNGVSVRSNP